MTASAPQLPQNPTPAGNPLQGGSRRFVDSVALMRNEAGSSNYTNRTSRFEIWHPSVRLHTAATIGFLPDTQEDATIPAGFTATMDAWARTSRIGIGQGRQIRGNGIIPGPFALPSTLPWTYESVTGVDKWIGTLTAPAGGTGLATSGWFVLNVIWEPAPGATDISQAELERIFQSCKIFPGAGPTVFNTIIG